MKTNTTLYGMIGIFLLVITFVSLAHPDRTIPFSPEPLGDPHIIQALLYGQDPPPSTSSDEQPVFHTIPAFPPSIANFRTAERILGINTFPQDQKRIEVDLTNQKVYAFEGNNKVYDFTVSTGKWGLTPTGEFAIWAKVKIADDEGRE